MRLTIDSISPAELIDLIKLLKELKIDSFTIDSLKNEEKVIEIGDKSIDPTDMFGFTKDNPLRIEDFKRDSWKHRQ